MKKKEQHELDNSLKLLAKTSAIVFTGLVLSKIFTYVYKIIIARYFGPETYGLFSLASMILGLFVVFSSFGLSEGLLRYISIYRGRSEINKIRYILRFSLVILFFSGIVFGSIMFLSSEFISVEIFHNSLLIPFLKWFSLLIPLSTFLYTFLSTLRAYEKISVYSFIINILQPAINLIFIISLIFIGLNSNSIIISYAGAIIIALLISFLICKYKLPDIFDSHNLNNSAQSRIFSDLFSYSWPLIFLSAVTNLFVWIDSFAVGYFLGVSEVGLYNVSTTLANLFNFISVITASLFYPLILGAFAKEKKNLIKGLSQQIAKWAFVINLPILILFILFPGAIINVLFGSEYLVAEDSLRILSIGGFIFSVLSVSKDLISMEGKSKLLLVDFSVIAILNFLLNLILIPQFGIRGAAFSTASSFVILGLVLILQSKNYLSIAQLSRKVWKVFISSIIPTMLLVYSKHFLPKNLFSLILQGISFILIYLLAVLLTKSLDRNDLLILRSIKVKILKR